MLGTDLILFATVMDVFRGAIMTVFIISAFLVILVVLAQEGKGGGLAGAFGGAGSETFGVKAGTVNTFTAWVGGLFLGLALLYAGLSTAESTSAEGVDTMNVPGNSAPEDGSGSKDDSEPKDDAGSKDDSEPKDDADAKDDSEPKDDAGAKDDSEPKDDAGAKDDSEPKDDAGAKDDGEPKDDADAKDK